MAFNFIWFFFAAYLVWGRALESLKGNFESRKLVVVQGSARSNILAQNFWVLQGSKWDTLFVDIYSSQFSILCDDNPQILYANDTCIVCVTNVLELLSRT